MKFGEDAPGYNPRKGRLSKGKRRLERHIEKDCVRLAEKRWPGTKAIKLNTWGRVSWPDRQFFFPAGKMLLVEFKKPGEKPTPDQRHIHRDLKKLGHIVHIIKSVDEFKALLKTAGL